MFTAAIFGIARKNKIYVKKWKYAWITWAAYQRITELLHGRAFRVLNYRLS